MGEKDNVTPWQHTMRTLFNRVNSAHVYEHVLLPCMASGGILNAGQATWQMLKGFLFGGDTEGCSGAITRSYQLTNNPILESWFY